MAYDDSFYYGQCRLVCTSPVDTDNGKTVRVTNISGKVWSGVMANRKVEFLVPPRDHYKMEIMDGDTVRTTRELDCGYGECHIVEIGADKTTPLGIKDILNNGLVLEYFNVGDEISFLEGSNMVKYVVLHINYNRDANGDNIIFGRASYYGNMAHNCNNNQDIVENSTVYKNMNGSLYNSYSDELKGAIKRYTFTRYTYNNQTTQVVANVWLPVATNVFGVISSMAAEANAGQSQFDYYKSLANRTKDTSWWLSSGWSGTSTSGFSAVTPSGGHTSELNGNVHSVFPCFMIAAD